MTWPLIKQARACACATRPPPPPRPFGLRWLPPPPAPPRRAGFTPRPGGRCSRFHRFFMTRSVTQPCGAHVADIATIPFRVYSVQHASLRPCQVRAGGGEAGAAVGVAGCRRREASEGRGDAWGRCGRQGGRPCGVREARPHRGAGRSLLSPAPRRSAPRSPANHAEH